jgi:hypothetical protein
LIWNTEEKEKITKISTDILLQDAKQNNAIKQGNKIFYPTNGLKPIGYWRKTFYDLKNKPIGYMIIVGPSMQSNTNTFITSNPIQSYINKHMVANISKNNLIEMSIYLTIRQCIEHTWINDREQYFSPNDGWKNDGEFQNNCLVFTLFHGQNRISSQHGVNHWIPFTEREVDAKEKFASAFMSGFLKGKTFSAEALAVLDAGRELWKYYHAKTKTNRTASVNASFYDIREFFQGRNDKGAMRTKSDDATYNELLAALRNRLRALTEEIQPKVYEYGFLKE